MKKFLAVAFMIFFFVSAYANRVNWVIAGVDNYSITAYDLRRMKEFGIESGNPQYSEEEAFKDLMLSYALLSYARQDAAFDISEEDLRKTIVATTNVQNITDPEELAVANYRRELYLKYPDEFRLQIRKQHIIRGMLFYNEELKTKAGREVTEAERQAFYNENKEKFVQRPTVDFIVFAAHQPRNITLNQLEEFEKAFQDIANMLGRNNNHEAVFNKYRNRINFLPYSGRTGERSAYNLIQDGYPEEIINICYMDQIPMPQRTITVAPGRVIGFPQPIPIGQARRPTYLVIKLISRAKPEPMKYDEVKGFIDNYIREENMSKAVEEYIINAVNENKVNINLIDDGRKYQGVYNEIIRR